MQSPPPKVSVIIPNYNHARYLPQRIESVLRQTYGNLEVLLLDDCSPDNSREVIARYAAQDARIRVVLNERNSGSTFKQWNKAFALIDGQYVWIAESDDYAAPDLLETLVGQLERDATVGLAYCNSAIVDKDSQEVDTFDEFYGALDPQLWTQDFVRDGRSLITSFMSYRNIIPNASAVVIRKSVLDRVGKANETFKVNGDWIFWASAIAKSKVAYTARKLNYFRYHPNNARSKMGRGTALNELTQVLTTMQQYGQPNAVLFNKMMDTLTETWVEELIRNDTALKINRQIYKRLKAVDPIFVARFLVFFKKALLSNKLSGIRQFLGDGLLYKFFKNK